MADDLTKASVVLAASAQANASSSVGFDPWRIVGHAACVAPVTVKLRMASASVLDERAAVGDFLADCPKTSRKCSLFSIPNIGRQYQCQLHAEFS